MKLRLSVNRTPQRPAVRAVLGVLSGTLLLGLTACEPVTIPDSGGTAVDPMAGCPTGADLAPANDQHSMYSTARQLGATAFWDKGYTGAGVDIAVIDTGVAPVYGLNAPNKVINGPDLSFESQSPYPYKDTFGHGTHMASIAAGRDAAFTATVNPAAIGTAGAGAAYVNNTTHFLGIAPDARIVNLKVADHEGAADVTQVIAAVNWVVEHKNTDGLNIRVLNLSYGVVAYDTWRHDPLSYAVDQAWKAGIVVVTPAGNDGRAPKTPLNSPAYNENVIAVGAFDPVTNTVPDFSNDSGRRLPDFVAPGKSIAGLRVCGSEQDNRIADDRDMAGDTWTSPYVGNRFVRGSGTSQAAAVVSGAAALMVQKNPCWTATQIKSALRQSAKTIQGELNSASGQGRLDMTLAYKETRQCGASLGSPGWALGDGSLDNSRAGSYLWNPAPYCNEDDTWTAALLARLVAMFPGVAESYWTDMSCKDWGFWAASQDGVVLRGEKDIFGKPFNSVLHAVLTYVDPVTRQIPVPGAWVMTPDGETWNGSLWTGRMFVPSGDASLTSPVWEASVWRSNAWNASTWRTEGWTASSWKQMVWDASSWRASNWDASTWKAENWTASTWRASSWKASTWRASSWKASVWRAGSWQASNWRDFNWTASTWRSGIWG